MASALLVLAAGHTLVSATAASAPGAAGLGRGLRLRPPSTAGAPPAGLWAPTLGAAGGGGYVFLKHIRKAGGTTLRKVLINAIQYHNESRQDTAALPPPPVVLYEQEWGAMDRNCPVQDPVRWGRALKVVSLRDPVSRQLSEFFYAGDQLFTYILM